MDIARAGYATSPTYASTLLAVMERYLTDLMPSPIVVRWNVAIVPRDGVRVEGGRVYVQIRRLADVLSMAVRYDQASRTVHVEGGPR